MKFDYPFDEAELAAIATLPPKVQALADTYPTVFENFAADYQLPPLPPGTRVEHLEFYYGTENVTGPELFISDGELHSTELSADSNTNVIQVLGSDGWLYIKVEGYEILNRWLDACLPEFTNFSVEKQIQVLQAHLV
jgi:hypothetical protein